MTDTIRKLNWTETGADKRGDTSREASFGHWHFQIWTPRRGLLSLTARSEDGERRDSLHDTFKEAERAAVNCLHPAQAMVWEPDPRPGRDGSVYAVWGPLTFESRRTPSRNYRFTCDLSAGGESLVIACRTLGSGDEVREAAAEVLCTHYGPVPGVDGTEGAEGRETPAQTLAAALRRRGWQADQSGLNEALAEAGLSLVPGTDVP